MSMENSDLLFYEVPEQWNGTKIHKWIKIKTNGKRIKFTGNELYIMMTKLLKVSLRYKTEDIEGVYIDFNKTTFRDKAVYILFEIFIYHLLKTTNLLIKIEFKERDHYPGFLTSLLYKNLYNKMINKNKFIKEFEMKKDLTLTKMRYIISVDEKDDYFSKLMGDVYSFLNTSVSIAKIEILGKEIYIEELSEVITELAGNAVEHSKSSCLLDINIAIKDINKISIDVVILNVSEILLGDKLRKQIKEKNNKNINSRMLEALSNHKLKFSEDYTEEDFFNIVAFQYRASTRLTSSDDNDGTGLTRLLESLINKSEESSNCYVMSGNKIIFFKKKLLMLDAERFIGFNEKNDFINNIPANEAICRSKYNLKGTLYNLNFIIS